MHQYATQSTTLVFGPQPLAFNQNSLRELGASIEKSPALGWVEHIVAELPDRFDEVCEEIPRLSVVPGSSLLRTLGEQLKAGSLDRKTEASELPSIVLTPLCVISHLAAYTKYVELIHGKEGWDTWRPNEKNPSTEAQVVGFCTGLLAALVVSLSREFEDFKRYGAIAIRLAMIIGAVVDAEDVMNGDSCSFSAVWKTREALAEMEKIIRRYEDAYISVRYDENRATVTALRANLSKLMEMIDAVGISTVEIRLAGRFHSETHRSVLRTLNCFCESNTAFELPDACRLWMPCRADVDPTGRGVMTGKLSSIALDAILVQPSEWWRMFMSLATIEKRTRVIILSPEKCIPPSIVHNPPTNCQIMHLADLISHTGTVSAQSWPQNDNDIAVIGMACKVAGAEDIDEFWDLLCAGQSQHTEVPASRFTFETSFRDIDQHRKWYGNFIDSYDCFDHKFFKKTPREAAAMDPQQRLLLEIAYQAISESGYFQKSTPSANVGCFIGTCAVDYEYNAACHSPNAFTSTGNLRGFIGGKVSHHFGWTGPSMTIDTACSGAAVAIHQACKNILDGECEYALAGGVNIITQPLSYQNLAAASFLSPTGQCKPFCATADGYCRGEGIGAVFLKKHSAALADGDRIFGVISGTAVCQNQNITPIFVPNAPSLSSLFQTVLRKAHLTAGQISYVEAHGTGTTVGDPAEYESISGVFGEANRARNLQLGSVKGLVGHTESASGVISLIKVLLMMHHRMIPSQPSFQRLNPEIKAHDSVEISTILKPWSDPLQAALINNYGASGSNASIIVKRPAINADSANNIMINSKYPFWLSASNEKCLQAYVHRLGKFLKLKACRERPGFMRDFSFNVYRQSNRNLQRTIFLCCSTVDELEKKLCEVQTSIDRRSPPPVVLCFGGQVSTFIGLDREIVATTNVRRFHLDRCDEASILAGFGSIYPEIFQKTPLDDVVKLQLCLFSSQYASAMSWIGCGIQPSALIGHSFGELTVLCVSGVLGLQDTIQMVAGRAKIIRDQWGPDRGAMMAVEGSPDKVEALLSASVSVGHPVEIACYNGPKSFTLAGKTKAIETVAESVQNDKLFSSIRGKRLNVSNAFHSVLVDDLVTELDQMACSLEFGEPKIPIEFTTNDGQSRKLGPEFISHHLRNPVYFHHAVKRLSSRLHSCVWLEAGSNSTITQMAGRANSESTSEPDVFIPTNLTTDASTTTLAETTLDLWNSGVDVAFWQHHPSQASQYNIIMLPPYQFEKSKHWMELKVLSASPVIEAKERKHEGLWAFETYQGPENRTIRFRVLCDSEEYKSIVSGHVVAQTAPICPATLEVSMAIDALISVHPKLKDDSLQPQILYVKNHAPICFDPSRVVWLDLTAKNDCASPCREWNWELTSESSATGSTITSHVTGELVFQLVEDASFQLEFARYERLVSHKRCVDLLYGNESHNDIVQGPSIYRIFDTVVQYGGRFKGLKRLVGRGSTSESAGLVTKRYAGGTWLDPDLSDCFSQVGGIWVNCMTETSVEDMYIANGFEKWVWSPKALLDTTRPGTWEVFACHERRGSNAFLTDIFIFDPRNGALVEVILGISFAKVSKLSMSKLLARLSTDVKATLLANLSHNDSVIQGMDGTLPSKELATSGIPKPDVTSKIRRILADLSGLDACEIKEKSHLADLGIDSLMGMELAREIEGSFGCPLSADVLIEIFSVEGLVHCVKQHLGLEMSENSDINPSSATAIDTPLTSVGIPCDIHTSEVQSNACLSQPPLIKSKNACMGAGEENGLEIPSSAVLDAFAECKALTDRFIEEQNCQDYLEAVMPMQTKLCIALTLEAFAQLGCDLRLATAGQELKRIPCKPSLERFVVYLYDMLEAETHIIKRDGTRVIRTSVVAPGGSSSEKLRALMHASPQHQYSHMLTYYAGSRLADVLSGTSDGIKVIFGTDEGRQLVSALYADSPLNILSYMQMQDFLKRLCSRLPKTTDPLKILELGAGTGGTTKWIVPLLAELDISVEYIVSDLSSSFVAAARKEFGKKYPFMSFKTVDIEKEPAHDLLNSQHIVLASNAVHATHSLSKSLGNVRKTLLPGGIMMILEMTRTIYWVDMIFGLLEGWWLFNDGRQHAIADLSRWQKDLYSAGYSHVDFSEGNHPEANIQRVFLAVNGGDKHKTLPDGDVKARQAAIDAYVERYTRNFSIPNSPSGYTDRINDLCILVTGATGSLGSHLVAHLSNLPQVKKIICLNRRGGMDPHKRQVNALESRGIRTANIEKFEAVETDTASPMLGMEQDQYDLITSRITHVIHNAWPMSGKRPLKGFEGQFKAMRNIIDLASTAASVQGLRIGVQLISSIAVVGHCPIMTGDPLVLERKVETAAAVLANGYGEAKWVCERMLDETLHKYPQSFRVMTVRLGQIAGSKKSGYWNHMEHITFMLQSSQALNAFPELDGLVSWTPVDDAAAALCDLVTHHTTASYSIYHIDNPVRQPWSELVPILAGAIGAEVVSFQHWLEQVRSCCLASSKNPAAQLIDFFEHDYKRMSCGGLLLDTTQACEHSEALRAVGPLAPGLVQKYVEAWKSAGVLRQ